MLPKPTRALLFVATLAVLGCGSLGTITPGGSSDPSMGEAQEPRYATRDGSVVQIHPAGYRFEIPSEWLNWHDMFGNNLHLSSQELRKARRSNEEWEKEYAQVTNAIFPFSRCSAHVGEFGWRAEGAGGGLQVRVYDFENSLEELDATIRRQGAIAVTKLTKEPAEVELSDLDGWRRAQMHYRRFYLDYGGLARVDIRYREFGPSTIAFAFMYDGDEGYEKAIAAMLASITPPNDE